MSTPDPATAPNQQNQDHMKPTYNRYQFLLRTTTGSIFCTVVAISWEAALADLNEAYVNPEIITCTIYSA